MRIIRNYFYAAGYNLLILLTPLLTVPYISRVLGPTGVGINATTNSIITYFLLFGTVGITIYGNREIAFIRDNRGQRSQTFWEIEILQLLTISCAYLAFNPFFTHHKTTCKKQNKAILQIDLHRLPYVNSKYYLPNPKESMHKQRCTSSPNERCNPRNNDPVLPVAVSLVLNW